MERDDGEPAFGLKRLETPVEHSFELAQFVVHRQPQRLEYLGRRVLAARPWIMDRSLHKLRELARAGERRLGAGLDDLPGDLARFGLLAEVPENPGQLLFRKLGHEIG